MRLTHLLVLGVSGRSSKCFGCINMGFLSSPLVVADKGFKLTRNRSMGHGLVQRAAKSAPFFKYSCLVVRYGTS